MVEILRGEFLSFYILLCKCFAADILVHILSRVATLRKKRFLMGKRFFLLLGKNAMSTKSFPMGGFWK